MDTGDEKPEDSSDEEPSVLSVADLASSLDGSSDPDDVDVTASDDEPRETTTFADLVTGIRGDEADAGPPVDSAESPPQGRDIVPGTNDVERADATSESVGRASPPGGFDGNAKTEAMLELVGDSANVLLLGELLQPEEYDVCTRLLSAETPSNLLLVTLTQSSDERLNICHGYMGDLPGDTTIVSVGVSSRTGEPSSVTDGSGQLRVETLADPTDLMRLGIVVSRQLSEFEESGLPTAVCFHSLSALLQFVDDRRTVFRFIHTLRGRVKASGARAHYHLDSEAHDDQLISLLRPLFDVTLRIDDDGSVSLDQGP